jgi:hypothetical protein
MMRLNAFRLLLVIALFTVIHGAHGTGGRHRMSNRGHQRRGLDESADEASMHPPLLTNADFENHPALNTSLENFLQIEKTMQRAGPRASFHSYVHLIEVGIRLLNASTVLEIGSYCGATIALGLGVPSVEHFVAVDMRPNNKNPNTHDIIENNIALFNKR